MNINYKHLGMYLVAGIASGLLCHFSSIIDIDLMFFSTNFTPSIILGIMIFLAGHYISGITPRNTWLNPLVLILACSIGWFLNYEFNAGDCYWYWCVIEAGIIGGFFIAIGLVIAWRLKRIWMVIVLTTLAGGLGGLVWGYAFRHFSIWNSSYIEVVLFQITWPSILLLGIGIAIQIDSRKSSIEK
jgi:hypothetical protein